MKKLKLTIEGMHCSSCAANVERALRNVSGVKDVSVSVLTKKSIISLEDTTSIDDIKKAVSKAGYTVKEVVEG